jgi:hypothetical protein
LALEIWLAGQFNFEALYNYVRGYSESDDVSEQEGGRFTFHLRGVKDVTYQAYSGGKVRILVDDFSDPGTLVGIIWDMAEIASGKPPMFTPKKIVPLNATTYRIARPLILSELAPESLDEIDEAKTLSKETAGKIQSVRQKLIVLNTEAHLFDQVARDYLGPADYAESWFPFLNRSAQTEVQNIRDLLQKWFDIFPPSGKMELRSRFRSADDRQHLAAFFELYCHALLRHQRFGVKLHRTVSADSSTAPDFFAQRDGKPMFYMESTLSARSDAESAAQARLDHVYDIVSRLKSPSFSVGVQIRKFPSHAPSASRIRSFLKGRLAKLDPDEITEMIATRGWDSVPHWRWSENGWEVVFYPIPKAKEHRGNSDDRLLGAFLQTFEKLQPGGSLPRALKSKATHYGSLDIPYVIAVNVTDLFINELEIVDALFGEERITLDMRTRETSSERLPDGLWVGPDGPRNQRVSAILVTRNLDPWSIAGKDPVLWHNPWARHPLSMETWQGSQKTLDLASSEMTLLEGKHAWEILELAPKWPVMSEP